MRDLAQSQIVESSLPMLLHLEDRNSMAHGVAPQALAPASGAA